MRRRRRGYQDSPQLPWEGLFRLAESCSPKLVSDDPLLPHRGSRSFSRTGVCKVARCPFGRLTLPLRANMLGNTKTAKAGGKRVQSLPGGVRVSFIPVATDFVQLSTPSNGGTEGDSLSGAAYAGPIVVVLLLLARLAAPLIVQSPPPPAPVSAPAPSTGSTSSIVPIVLPQAEQESLRKIYPHVTAE